MNNTENAVDEVIKHLGWEVKYRIKYNRPVCLATSDLLEAFTKQMQELYKEGYDDGLEEAHKFADSARDQLIQDMRNYAKEHPKTTLESYLKRNYS